MVMARNESIYGYSSQNAKPLSKILNEDLARHGINLPKSFFRWLAAQRYIETCGWEYTGKLKFETDLYDLNNVKRQLARLDLVALEKQYSLWKRSKCPVKSIPHLEEGYFAFVVHKEWVGNKYKGSLVVKREYAFVYRGFAYFSPNQRKNCSDSDYQEIQRFQRKPKEMDKSLVYEILKSLRIL